MLRPYPTIRHRLCGAQSFVNYIFLEIICKAPRLKTTYETFPTGIVIEKYRPLLEQTNEKYLLRPLKTIYAITKDLSREEIRVIKRGVLINNRIRELCTGQYKPVLYSDLEKIDRTLARNIKLFCNNLYVRLPALKPFKDRYTDFDTYYKALIGSIITCRCCGVDRVLNQFHMHRSALDHYLPKDKYPFISMNPRNLVPICDICNAKYKLAKNTLYLTEIPDEKQREKARIKAFYPFRREEPDIHISISLSEDCKLDAITPDDITMNFSCNDHQQEVDNWRRIFGIDNNYQAILCSEDMYGFYEENYIAKMTKGETHEEYLQGLEANKYRDMNFLKTPFLECLK